jgi:hypothetical protein
VLGGDAQDLAIGLASGEHGVHDRRATYLRGDSVRQAGPAFFFRQRDVLPKAARAGEHGLVHLARDVGWQLDPSGGVGS